MKFPIKRMKEHCALSARQKLEMKAFAVMIVVNGFILNAQRRKKENFISGLCPNGSVKIVNKRKNLFSCEKMRVISCFARPNRNGFLFFFSFFFLVEERGV